MKGVLPLQIGLMKEGCERVKSSAAALRNLLAPPLVAPAVDENLERKKATAAKLARLFSSALFGTYHCIGLMCATLDISTCYLLVHVHAKLCY